MPRIKRPIEARKVEFVCEQCMAGVYRLTSKKPVTSDYIHKWQHRCTNCGKLLNFTVPYPLLEVDGECLPVSFIQHATLPPPDGPGREGFYAGRLTDGGEFELWN